MRVRVLSYFVCPFARVGARSWVVDTAGHGGHSILQGLGCWSLETNVVKLRFHAQFQPRRKMQKLG